MGGEYIFWEVKQDFRGFRDFRGFCRIDLGEESPCAEFSF